MSEVHLHIISFTIPYPPNYGGAIDVFYKIKALHSAGVKVHLHCFSYDLNLKNTAMKYIIIPEKPGCDQRLHGNPTLFTAAGLKNCWRPC